MKLFNTKRLSLSKALTLVTLIGFITQFAIQPYAIAATAQELKRNSSDKIQGQFIGIPGMSNQWQEMKVIREEDREVLNEGEDYILASFVSFDDQGRIQTIWLSEADEEDNLRYDYTYHFDGKKSIVASKSDGTYEVREYGSDGNVKRIATYMADGENELQSIVIQSRKKPRKSVTTNQYTTINGETKKSWSQTIHYEFDMNLCKVGSHGYCQSYNEVPDTTELQAIDRSIVEVNYEYIIDNNVVLLTSETHDSYDDQWMGTELYDGNIIEDVLTEYDYDFGDVIDNYGPRSDGSNIYTHTVYENEYTYLNGEHRLSYRSYNEQAQDIGSGDETVYETENFYHYDTQGNRLHTAERTHYSDPSSEPEYSVSMNYAKWGFKSKDPVVHQEADDWYQSVYGIEPSAETDWHYDAYLWHYKTYGTIPPESSEVFNDWYSFINPGSASNNRNSLTRSDERRIGQIQDDIQIETIKVESFDYSNFWIEQYIPIDLNVEEGHSIKWTTTPNAIQTFGEATNGSDVRLDPTHTVHSINYQFSTGIHTFNITHMSEDDLEGTFGNNIQEVYQFDNEGRFVSRSIQEGFQRVEDTVEYTTSGSETWVKSIKTEYYDVNFSGESNRDTRIQTYSMIDGQVVLTRDEFRNSPQSPEFKSFSDLSNAGRWISEGVIKELAGNHKTEVSRNYYEYIANSTFVSSNYFKDYEHEELNGQLVLSRISHNYSNTEDTGDGTNYHNGQTYTEFNYELNHEDQPQVVSVVTTDQYLQDEEGFSSMTSVTYTVDNKQIDLIKYDENNNISKFASKSNRLMADNYGDRSHDIDTHPNWKNAITWYMPEAADPYQVAYDQGFTLGQSAGVNAQVYNPVVGAQGSSAGTGLQDGYIQGYESGFVSRVEALNIFTANANTTNHTTQFSFDLDYIPDIYQVSATVQEASDTSSRDLGLACNDQGVCSGDSLDVENGESYTLNFNIKNSSNEIIFTYSTTHVVTGMPVNMAPVATPATMTATEDTPLNGQVAATDVDGDNLTFTLVGGVQNGTLTFNNDGSYNYVPNANFSGTDSFTFKANDGNLDSPAVAVNLNVTAVNDIPVATPATMTATEDTPLNGQVAATDVDGDNLTFTLVGGVQNGTLTFNNDGSYNYVPNANFSGTDSFTFKANDGNLDSPAVAVNLNVTAVNDIPVATPATMTATEDTPLNGQVAATDVDGDNLTFTLVGGVQNGTLTFNNDGSYNYVPNANFSGTDSFTFKANDGNLDSPAVAVNLNVTAVNDIPVATPATMTATEDTPLNGQVAATDVDGDNLTFTLVGGVQNGTLTFNNDGSYNYVPNANFSGTDSFTFKANDGNLDSPAVAVNLNVTAVNDIPVATPATMTATEDTPLNGQVAATDVDGDNLTFTLVGGVQNGTLTFNNDGSYNYVPNANFSGTDSFTFKANDGNLDSPAVAVNLNVTAVNDIPVATPATMTATEDTPLNGQVAATDVDGDNLTFTLVGGVQNGTLTFNNDGSYNYVPNANFSGTDSFTFKANDGNLDSPAVAVNLNVTAVNDIPVATPATMTATEDTPLNGQVAATDVDGDNLTFTLVGGVQNGTLTFNNDGSYNYVPNANFSGTDSFTFKANDGNLDSPAVAVNLNVTAVNDIPVATPATMTATEDTPLNGQVAATDVDGDNLTFTLVGGVQNGTLTFNNDGSYNYVPNANFSGTDSFTFKANDGNLDSVTAVININVSPVNDIPGGQAQSFSGQEDQSISGQVHVNDSDNDKIILSIVRDVENGSLSLNNDGSFIYSPNTNYSGTDSFLVRAFDGQQYSENIKISFTVTNINDIPVPLSNQFSLVEDNELVDTLIATDVDGDKLTYELMSDPLNGSINLNSSTGSFVYIPNENFQGNDTFVYRVSDGKEVTGLQSVTLNISNTNDIPVATPATMTATEDTPLNGQVAATDVDGDNLTFTLVGGVQNGTLTFNNDGSYNYVPNANFSGTDSFTFKANDGNLDSPAVAVNLNVTAVNDIPVATPATMTATEDTPLNGQVAATDVDGDNLTFTLVGGVQNGTLTFNNDGSYNYVPNANFSGTDSFTFKANDGNLDSPAVAVNLNVTAVNDIPVATPATMTATEDTPLNGQVAATDVDGDNLTFTLVGGVQNGTLTFNNDGSYNYVPNANFSGTDSFTFKANDGNLDSPAVAVNLNVTAVNDIPVATPATMTATEDTPLNGQVAATDVDGDNLTFTLVGGVQNGTLTFNNDGSYNYVPNANFSGTDSFTFKANDGNLDSPAVAVNLNVTAVNDIPVATPATMTATEDTPLNGQVAATDVDGDNLTFTLVGGVQNGTLTFNNDGSYNYVPNANFSGTDSFTFKANDGNLDSPAVAVNLNVTAVNDIPVATPATMTATEDTPLNGQVAATDVDGDNLTFTLVGGVQNGTLTFNNDGSYNYVPNANFSGTDSFTFKANDGNLDSVTAVININIAAINDAPTLVVTTPHQIVSEDNSITDMLQIVDDDMSAIQVFVSNQPVHGKVTIDSSGVYTYTPNDDFSGSDGFSVYVSDGENMTDPVAISFEVQPINDVPIAYTQSPAVRQNNVAYGQLSATDVDSVDLKYMQSSGVKHGQLTLNENGSYMYIPDEGYFGVDSFEFYVFDGYDYSMVVNVLIQVTEMPDADEFGIVEYEYDNQNRVVVSHLADGRQIRTNYEPTDRGIINTDYFNLAKEEAIHDKFGNLIETLVYVTMDSWGPDPVVHYAIEADGTEHDCFHMDNSQGSACIEYKLGLDAIQSELDTQTQGQLTFGDGIRVAAIEIGDEDHADGMEYILETVAEGAEVDTFVTSNTANAIAESIKQVADEGYDVINMSLNITNHHAVTSLKKAIEYALDVGVTSVVIAAGNEGGKLSLLAEIDGVTVVGSTDMADRRADHSNYGKYLDVMTQGIDVLSRIMNATSRMLFTGTSISTAIVSGIVAGLLSVDRYLNGAITLEKEDVNELLVGTADDAGSTGRDDYFGYGLLNPLKALKSLLSDNGFSFFDSMSNMMDCYLYNTCTEM